jgi:hypothetical protein
MESLALLVAIILSVAIVGGPLSLLFAFLYQRNSRKFFNRSVFKTRLFLILTILFAVPAILVGIRLLTLDIAFGGKFFGGLGVLTGASSLYKVFESKFRSH